jgi:hypothetical protein
VVSECVKKDAEDRGTKTNSEPRGRSREIIPISDRENLFFFRKLCKESAINPTNHVNMRIRSPKVLLGAALTPVAIVVAGSSGSAGAEDGKFDWKQASGCVCLS